MGEVPPPAARRVLIGRAAYLSVADWRGPAVRIRPPPGSAERSSAAERRWGVGVPGGWGGAGRTAGRLDGEPSWGAVRAKSGREGGMAGPQRALGGRGGGWCQWERKTLNFEAEAGETKGSPKGKGGRCVRGTTLPGTGCREASAAPRMLRAVAPVPRRPRARTWPTPGPAIARLQPLTREGYRVRTPLSYCQICPRPTALHE